MTEASSQHLALMFVVISVVEELLLCSIEQAMEGLRLPITRRRCTVLSSLIHDFLEARRFSQVFRRVLQHIRVLRCEVPQGVEAEVQCKARLGGTGDPAASQQPTVDPEMDWFAEVGPIAVIRTTQVKLKSFEFIAKTVTQG